MPFPHLAVSVSSLVVANPQQIKLALSNLTYSLAPQALHLQKLL
jgi:hypothetical protein